MKKEMEMNFRRFIPLTTNKDDLAFASEVVKRMGKENAVRFLRTLSLNPAYQDTSPRGVLAKRQVVTWLRVGRFLCVTLPTYARAVRHGAWEVLRNAAIIAGLWLVAAILMGGGN